VSEPERPVGTQAPGPGVQAILNAATGAVDGLKTFSEIASEVDSVATVEDLRRALLFVFPSGWQDGVAGVVGRLDRPDLVALLTWLCLQFKLGHDQAMGEVRAAAARYQASQTGRKL